MSCNPPARYYSSPKRNNLRARALDLDTTLAAEGSGSPVSGHTATSTVSAANEALAANLSVAFPRTPQRATPNSARKRRQIPDLSRTTPTSSHGTKMSMIFRDAAATLQDLRTPQSRPFSNVKKSRVPISQARATKFGSTGLDSTIIPTNFQTSSPTYKDRESTSGTYSGSQRPYPAQDFGTGRKSPIPTATSNVDAIEQGSLEIHHTLLPALPRPSSPTPIPTTTDGARRTCGEDKGREPISSGFATPSALNSQPPDTPEEICYSEFEHWQLPWSSSVPGSDGGDYLPSRGVPFALPASSPNTVEYHGAKIEDWLNDIHTLINADDGDPRIVQQQATGMAHLAVGTDPGTPAAMADKCRKKAAKFAIPKPKQVPHKTFSASSDKENVSPPKYIPSHTRPPVEYIANTPSRFRDLKLGAATQPNGALHFSHPLTPRGSVNVPPRRKKARVSLDDKPPDPPKSGKDFTIHDEQVADALAQLSPDVELRRKGRRPKRERCVSYWDEDIVQPDSPCMPIDVDGNAAPVRKGRKVLGESQQTAELTKEKPFAKEAGNAAFNSRIAETTNSMAPS